MDYEKFRHLLDISWSYSYHVVSAPLFRIQIEPDDTNGLSVPSQIMVDKMVAVSKQKIGAVFGHLSNRQLLKVDRSLAVFLGIAS